MRGKQLRHGLMIGALMVVAAWLVTSIWSLATRALVAVEEAQSATRKLSELDKRRAALEASLGSLESDRGHDAAIRTTFGVARPGEEVIVVVPPVVATTSTPKSWWQSILDWF